jgi:hypothetical protein
MGSRLVAAAALTVPLGAGIVAIAPAPAFATGCNGFTVAHGLAPGTINEPYSDPVRASNGVTPYHFAVTHGSLPVGLTMSDAGVISGTPLVPGTSTFDVTGTDSSSPVCTDTETLTLKVGTQVDGELGSVEDIVGVVAALATDPSGVSCLEGTIDTLLNHTPPVCPGF